VRKGDADLRGAVKLARSDPPLHDLVCFHCQQGAEKYLKAMLEELGLTIPRTHELEHLLTLLLPHHAVLRGLQRGLSRLTAFAVDPRYPGDDTTKRQAQGAMRSAEAVRTTCRALLGIRGRRRPRKKKP
jgi:HEPN domain-containing protein